MNGNDTEGSVCGLSGGTIPPLEWKD